MQRRSATLKLGLITTAIVAAVAVLGLVACGVEPNRPPADFARQTDRAAATCGVAKTVAAGLMLCASVAGLCLVSRNRSVQSDAPHGIADTAGGWPRRRHYLLAALAFSAVAVYGSLVPFRYAPLEFAQAVGRLKEILNAPVRLGLHGNFVANVLLFVPIGFCLLAALAVDRHNRVLTALCVPAAGSLCAALSVAVESAQLWFPGRYPSPGDIVAQMIGAAAGIGLWLLVGRTVTDWVRSYTVSERPTEQIDWLLRAYCIGLLIYSLLPLDLITRPAELVHKYRQGRIALSPLAGAGWDFATFYGLFRDVAIFTPVGMLAATWMTSRRRPVRPRGTSVALGVLIVLAVETMHLLVYSRSAATRDLITGTIGVCAGVWAMHGWRGRDRAGRSAPTASPVARRAWLWLGLAAVYSLLLAAVFCEPFVAIDDLQQLKPRYNGFFRVPFGSRYPGSEFNMLSQIVKKGLLFAPLGALLTLSLARLPVPRPVRRILLGIALLAAAGVATAIEMAQVFLPPHVPSSTDVILCTLGAAIGMLVTLRIVDARRASARSVAPRQE